MSYQQAKIIDARFNDIRVQHPDLPAFPVTNANSSTAGTLSLTVGDNLGFSQNDLLVLGQVGQDKTEVVTVNAAVTRGTALTVTATSFDHPQDTPVSKSLWDQIEISGAATVTGSKTVITTISVQWSMPYTEYVNSGTAYTYYFARFKNSATGVFSAYSDAAPAGGYGSTTVRGVKVTALNLTGETIDDGVITDDFLNTEVTNCEIDIWKEKRRWAQFDVNDYVLGSLSVGKVSFPLPADISDPDTNEAIRSLRVRQIGELRYVQQEEYDGLLWDIAFTTLSVTANAGDTTLTLTSSGDFAASGTVTIDSDNITYTANNTTTNVLSGVPASGSGSVTATHTSGTNVWQGNETQMAPTVYTVKDQAVNIILPVSSSYLNQNLYINYYSKPTYPTTDTGLINWPDALLYHYFLAWKITLKRHDGAPTEASTNFKTLYDQRKALLLSRARLQDMPRMQPLAIGRRQDIAAVQNVDDFVAWVIK